MTAGKEKMREDERDETYQQNVSNRKHRVEIA